MTSGTTEKKPYSKEQMLDMLYRFLKEAANTRDALAQKANKDFLDASNKVKEKLEKNGITLTEFVDHSNMRDANP